MANIELLDEIIAAIKAHPENWDQSYWASAKHDGTFAQRFSDGQNPELSLTPECGTSFCIAGWVAVLTGAKIVWDLDDEKRYSLYGYRVIIDNDTETIAEYARKALELDLEQSYMLFYGFYTLEKIVKMRDALAEDPDQDLKKIWDLYL